VKRTLLWVIGIAILLAAYAVYRSRSGQMDVDPNAAREIEKAKRR
jgi:hypothetical protein